jgi:hypothetical protein
VVGVVVVVGVDVVVVVLDIVVVVVFKSDVVGVLVEFDGCAVAFEVEDVFSVEGDDTDVEFAVVDVFVGKVDVAIESDEMLLLTVMFIGVVDTNNLLVSVVEFEEIESVELL